MAYSKLIRQLARKLPKEKPTNTDSNKMKYVLVFDAARFGFSGETPNVAKDRLIRENPNEKDFIGELYKRRKEVVENPANLSYGSLAKLEEKEKRGKRV